MSERESVLSFLEGIDTRASTRVVRSTFGTGYFNQELPRVWSRNFIWTDRTVADHEIADLVREVNGLHEEAGLAHRRILFADEISGLRTGAFLKPKGWRVQADRVLSYRGDDGALADDGAVVEVAGEELEGASRELASSDEDIADEETAEQLLKAARLVAGATHERCFALEVDGAIVSYCRLFSDGETAQVEDVATLAEHRGRGHAAAVVSRAIRAATASHRLTFILARENDWPRLWYERIGFHPIGLIPELLKVG